MVNFRFHLVSLIAVFLALGLGILTGSAVVNQATVQGIRREIRDVRAEVNDLRDANGALTDELGRTSEFVAESAAFAVDGRLTGVPVAIVAERGVSEDAVERHREPRADGGSRCARGRVARGALEARVRGGRAGVPRRHRPARWGELGAHPSARSSSRLGSAHRRHPSKKVAPPTCWNASPKAGSSRSTAMMSTSRSTRRVAPRPHDHWYRRARSREPTSRSRWRRHSWTPKRRRSSGEVFVQQEEQQDGDTPPARGEAVASVRTTTRSPRSSPPSTIST